MTEETKAPKKMSVGKGCLIAIGVFLGLAFIGSLAGGGNNSQAPESNISKPGKSGPAAQASGGGADASTTTSSLTSAQSNAARSATQYLSMSGFSRDGLIQQLSSDAGDGYGKADATVAVDSLNVDWNAQAVKSAKQYLSMSGFSCKGLIQQLSSSAGDKYTREQAAFGAKQAGACD